MHGYSGRYRDDLTGLVAVRVQLDDEAGGERHLPPRRARVLDPFDPRGLVDAEQRDRPGRRRADAVGRRRVHQPDSVLRGGGNGDNEHYPARVCV